MFHSSASKVRPPAKPLHWLVVAPERKKHKKRLACRSNTLHVSKNQYQSPQIQITRARCCQVAWMDPNGPLNALRHHGVFAHQNAGTNGEGDLTALGDFCLNFPRFLCCTMLHPQIRKGHQRLTTLMSDVKKYQKSPKLQPCRGEVLAILSINASLLAFPEAANIREHPTQHGAAQKWQNCRQNCQVAEWLPSHWGSPARISRDTAIICCLNVSLSLSLYDSICAYILYIVVLWLESKWHEQRLKKINTIWNMSILCQGSKYYGLIMKGGELARGRVR